MAPSLVFALAVIGQTVPNSFPPNNQYLSNTWAARIRADVTGAADFDKLVPPNSNRALTAGPAGHYSDAGTDVSLQIRFFKVENVKAADGSMRLKVWWRMSWKDDRLAWDPAQYGGVSEVFYNAEGLTFSETSEIWLPDIQPYNALEGIVHTIEPAMARVTSDGSVFWSRPGSIEAMCKFSGLVAFPYDDLKCKIEVGGWVMSGGVQGLHLLGTGWQFSNQEATSGSSYQEMTIKNVSCELRTYTYPNFPSEPWPVVLYTITMQRGTGFYIFSIILPGILITCLSFAVFWADTASADALGFGIGVVIVNLLSNYILMGILPICGEVIWVHLFSTLNTVFCCISLFQSAFNIMIEQFDSDSLLPKFVRIPLFVVLDWLMDKIKAKPQAKVGDAPSQVDEASVARKKLASASVMFESVAGVLYRQEHAAEGKAWREASLKALREQSSVERAERLVFYEALFFKLDTDVTLYINWEECDLLLSYAALGLNPSARRMIFDEFDETKDGKLNRVEFVTMCSEILSHVNVDQMNVALENMDVARTSGTRRAKAHWTVVAKKVDTYARVTIPVAYAFGLVVVFNVRLSDEYATNDAAPMFDGFGPMEFTTAGIVWVIMYIVLAICVCIIWLRVEHKAERQAQSLQQDLKMASRESLNNFVSSRKLTSPGSGSQPPAPPLGSQRRVGAPM